MEKNSKNLNLDKMNLSLAGCGYLGIYHLGVASCVRRYLPNVYQNSISGASVGALVASAFLCGVPLEMCTIGVFDVVMHVRSGILGPITPDLDIMKILYEHMSDMLPEDAHLYCNKRLHISVTRYADCKNVLLSQFDSREDLLQALMCSCFIPLYCGYQPPEFHGVAYVDGGYSNNLPRLNESTVTVAPFYGESDICPRDQSGDYANINMCNTSIFINMKNCNRIVRILFPGPPEMLKELCQRGYNDAMFFLRENGVFPCSNCVAGDDDDQSSEKHAKCTPIEEAIPEEISNEIEAAVERLNQNFSYRLLQNRYMKILYYMNIPSILTMKVSYAIISRIFRKLQNTASLYLDNMLNDMPQFLQVCLQVTQLPMLYARIPSQEALNRLEDRPESEEFTEMNDSGISSEDEANSENSQSSKNLIIPDVRFDRSKDAVTLDLSLSQNSEEEKDNTDELLQVRVDKSPIPSDCDIFNISTKSLSAISFEGSIIPSDMSTGNDYYSNQFYLSEKAQNQINEEAERNINTNSNAFIVV